MIPLFDGSLDRRQLLTIGGMTLGGLSLANLFAARAAATPASPMVTGKSVIFLFQQGGPSQFETFDPKPDAPVDIRTIDGTCRRRSPASASAPRCEQLATIADKLTIVRSFQTGNAEHNIRPIVGPESLNANIGSLVSRVVGPTNPVTAMPTNAVLFPQAVCADVAQGRGRGDLTATGAVGGSYAPFVPGGTGELLRNLRLNLSPDRFGDRRALLAQLDELDRTLDREPAVASFDRTQRQACEALLSGKIAEALDLTQRGSAHRRPLRHQPLRRRLEFGPFEPRDARLLRGTRQVARQAAPHGPPALRGGLRLRHRSTPATKASGTCTPTPTTSTCTTAWRRSARPSITPWRPSSPTWRLAV